MPRTMLVVAGMLMLLVAAAPAAMAHTRLISSTPTDRETLHEPPEAVVLEFNEPVGADFNEVRVWDPAGARADAGVTQTEGAQVRVALAPPTQAGAYTVRYRVLSPDGHPIEGALAFTLTDQALAGAEPSPEGTTGSDAGPEPSPAAGHEPAAATESATGDVHAGGDEPATGHEPAGGNESAAGNEHAAGDEPAPDHEAGAQGQPAETELTAEEPARASRPGAFTSSLLWAFAVLTVGGLVLMRGRAEH